MDPLSQNRFDRIVATGPDSITEDDAAFLRARRSYLNSDQREVFADVLSDADESPKGPYDALSLKKLKALAKEREIEIATDATVEQIVEALTSADAAQ